jgi:hypothetical protein
MFTVGDFIVERGGWRAPQSFGVVKGLDVDSNGEQLLDVQFPTDRSYAFASHCQPYADWLSKNGF